MVTAIAALSLCGIAGSSFAQPSTGGWWVVVNNAESVPGDAGNRTFNSYNQPSVNTSGLVVFRGRSKGSQGAEPAHGIYTRDTSVAGAPLRVFDRSTAVPQPNNLGSTFIEPPSFPRIDMWSDTIATRGNHQPVWRYVIGQDPDTGEDIETRAGTTGIYTNPFGPLVSGANNLGAVPEFDYFAVPDVQPQTKFDVFPGAPAVTDGSTIVFKGNFTLPDGTSRTGVFYREMDDLALPSSAGPLSPAGGTLPVVRIADSASTLVPGSTTLFGSTAPPSAADGKAVFAGFDNEDSPTVGGIYLAPLDGPDPALTTLVSIGSRVPGERNAVFNRLGEGLSYDGRFVAFWGAWGTSTTTLLLRCPTDGNPALIAYCRATYPRGYKVKVPKKQGVFVHDTVTGVTSAVAKSPAQFTDFLFWNFSGLVPGTGESDEAGEPARWRAATFVAASGLVDGSLEDAAVHTVFKARSGTVVSGAYLNPVDGVYLRRSPDSAAIVPVVTSGMDGTSIDPAAVFDDDENEATPPVPLPVTTMGVEREGFRGNLLVLNVSMGTEEAGWAGVYMTGVTDQ